jgi:hypothetical protein
MFVLRCVGLASWVVVRYAPFGAIHQPSSGLITGVSSTQRPEFLLRNALNFHLNNEKVRGILIYKEEKRMVRMHVFRARGARFSCTLPPILPSRFP